LDIAVFGGYFGLTRVKYGLYYKFRFMKLQKDNSGRYNITIPVSIVRAKGWEKGEELEWEINDNGNILLKQ